MFLSSCFGRAEDIPQKTTVMSNTTAARRHSEAVATQAKSLASKQRESLAALARAEARNKEQERQLAATVEERRQVGASLSVSMAEKAAAQESIRRSEAQVSQLRGEVDDLRKRLDGSHAKHAELQAAMDAALAESSDVRVQLGVAQSERKALETLQEQVARL